MHNTEGILEMKFNIQQITNTKNDNTKLQARHVLTAVTIPYDSRLS